MRFLEDVETDTMEICLTLTFEIVNTIRNSITVETNSYVIDVFLINYKSQIRRKKTEIKK